MQPEATPDRRTVVVAALGTAGLGALAACGSGSGAASGAASSPVGGGSAGTSAGSSAGPSGSLVALSKVPVGGSVAVQAPDGRIVVAQPTAGTVVAFSAVCTHQGCPVQASGDKLDCPCHGSVFDAFTGKVLQGPAQAPLGAVPVKVSGQDVVAG